MENLTSNFKKWAIANKENIPNKKNTVFLTVMERKKDIAALLKEGFKIKAIYRYLSEMEKISCSYSTFRIHVNNIIGEQLESSNELHALNNSNQLADNLAHSNYKAPTKNKKKGNNKANKQANSISIKRFEHSSVPDVSKLIHGA